MRRVDGVPPLLVGHDSSDVVGVARTAGRADSRAQNRRSVLTASGIMCECDSGMRTRLTHRVADAEGRPCDPTRRLHPTDGSLGCRAFAHNRTWTGSD
jgi:hypothetical protein